MKITFFFALIAFLPWQAMAFGDITDLESYLSFKNWKEGERTENIEETKNREKMGRLYQCFGNCRIDRGDGFFKGSHRSVIYEKDEVQTIGDSYAWVYLNEGTLLRLAPQTSVSFNEFNVGIRENFLNVRINYGNVLWLSRLENKFIESNEEETDVLFFPHKEYFANRKSPDEKDLNENQLMSIFDKDINISRQYEFLNKLIEKNNQTSKGKKTFAFIVLPNATYIGYSPNIELVAIVGGKSYLKRKANEQIGIFIDDDKKNIEVFEEGFLQMRGYENKELTAFNFTEWMEVDARGRNVSEVKGDELYLLTAGEFVTKRIPSLLVAREIFFNKYSKHFFEKIIDKNGLKKNGYRLWGEVYNAKSDLGQRYEFLKKYTLKTETALLFNSAKLYEGLISRGEGQEIVVLNRSFFVTALNFYYKKTQKAFEFSKDEKLNSTQKLLWKKMHGIR